ncbi:MAG: CopM family metallochaperone [Gemmobacter sp.]
MKKLAIAATLAALVAGGTYVYAESDGMAGMKMGDMDMGNMDSPSSKAYAEVMNTMMAGMMVPYTGDADIDFAKGMIPHHQAAIDMAKVQLEFGKDPEMRKLAEAIIAAQESEIATLKAFLAAKGM